MCLSIYISTRFSKKSLKKTFGNSTKKQTFSIKYMIPVLYLMYTISSWFCDARNFCYRAFWICNMLVDIVRECDIRRCIFERNPFVLIDQDIKIVSIENIIDKKIWIDSSIKSEYCICNICTKCRQGFWKAWWKKGVGQAGRYGK